MNSVINYATTYETLLAGNKLVLSKMFSLDRHPEYLELNQIWRSGSRGSRSLRYRNNLSLITEGQRSILKLLKWSLSEGGLYASALSSRRAGISVWPWPVSLSPEFRASFPCSSPKILCQISKPVFGPTLRESRRAMFLHP